MALEEAQRTAGIEAPPQVSLDDYLNSVFSQGVLAAVHISRLSWHQKLEPVDYGQDKFPENFKAGHRVLLEGDVVEEIARAESQTRYWLQKASLKFPVELIRFVPKSRLGNLLTEFEERKTAYAALVQTLIEQYPQLRDAAREKYPDQWHRMAEAYPSAEKIRSAHAMRMDTFEYAFPKALAATNLDRLASDVSYRDQHARMIRQQEEQTRSTMSKFLSDTIQDLRGRVVERFQEVIKNSRAGTPVTSRTVTSLRNLLTEVREMDFVGDRGFQEQLKAVDDQLATTNASVFKDSASAMAALDVAMSGVVQYAGNTTGGAVQSLTAGFLTGKRRLSL